MKHNMKIKLEWNQRDILWPHDVKSQLIGKYHDVGRDWRQEKKEKTEDEKVGWHHWFKGQVFEQSLGDREGQGSLTWWVHVVTNSWTWLSDWTTTERNRNLNGSPNGFRIGNISCNILEFLLISDNLLYYLLVLTWSSKNPPLRVRLIYLLENKLLRPIMKGSIKVRDFSIKYIVDN